MDDPFCGAQGSVRKWVAIVGAVGDFDAFSGPGIEYGMIAHDITGSHALDADFVWRAFSDKAVTRVDPRFFQVPAFGRGQDFGEFQRGAAWRVFLFVMVRIDDFEVIVIAERPGRPFRSSAAAP